MSVVKEIVTIQAGRFSNFIGTHWWNLQESSFCYDGESSAALEINHDVLFREGLNLRGEVTYTPRMVLVDVSSSLKSISKECPLYRYSTEEDHKMLWDGPVDIVRESPVKQNVFLEQCQTNKDTVKKNKLTQKQEFDTSETCWSDYLKTNLHPKSFCIFNEDSYTEERNPLDVYSYSDDLWNREGGEMIEDSIRKMSEECDYLQGFHFLFDSHNAFAGVSNHILQFLDDEYKQKPVLSIPTFQDTSSLPVEDSNHQMHRLYAVLQSFYSMNNYSTIFSPLSMSNDVIKLSTPATEFPFIHYDASLMYHTSAICAAALESLTSPYRLKDIKFSLADVCTSMSTYNRKLVSSSLSFPFPLQPDAYLSEMYAKDVADYYFTSLTPFYKPDSERTLFQSAVLRGISENKFQHTKNLPHLSTREEIFGEFLNKFSASSVTTATIVNDRCNVSAPFPNILRIGDPHSGTLNSSATFNSNGLQSVPIAASMSSSDSAANFIEDLLSNASKRNFKVFVKCAETSFEKDAFGEITEALINLQECYQHY